LSRYFILGNLFRWDSIILTMFRTNLNVVLKTVALLWSSFSISLHSKFELFYFKNLWL